MFNVKHIEILTVLMTLFIICGLIYNQRLTMNNMAAKWADQQLMLQKQPYILQENLALETEKQLAKQINILNEQIQQTKLNIQALNNIHKNNMKNLAKEYEQNLNTQLFQMQKAIFINEIKSK